jgi:WD40 repeat protein
MSSLPVEILAQAFAFLVDDAKSYCSLARANKELYHIAQALGGPYKWPDLLFEHDNTTTQKHYVHQVKYSQNKRHVAIMLRVYENEQSTNFHRLVRILDIAHCNTSTTTGCQSIQDIPMARMTPFTTYCGNYFVAVEPRKVRVFQCSDNDYNDNDNDNQYQCVMEWATVDRIVGMQCYDSDHPKIALQTEPQDASGCTLTVCYLIEGTLVRRIPYTGNANFCLSQDDRVFACIDGFGRPLTVIYMSNDYNSCRTYILNLPGNPRRSFFDTCKFSPDSKKLAVLTSEWILQLDTSVEPPQWMEDCAGRAPEGCTFSGQFQYSCDSLRLVAHAQTPGFNIYFTPLENLNTIQIWDACTMTLQATKGFHDLIGSVSLSLDGKFVVVIQGDASDFVESAITQIVTCYVAAMENYNP